jgi:hypothetical protein
LRSTYDENKKKKKRKKKKQTKPTMAKTTSPVLNEPDIAALMRLLLWLFHTTPFFFEFFA